VRQRFCGLARGPDIADQPLHQLGHRSNVFSKRQWPGAPEKQTALGIAL